MTFNPLITVVIPFYKGEKTIEQSIRSIFEQPYKNVEVVIVNDGSPTGSDVCKSIKAKSSQIRYYEKHNEGIGATRNFGLAQAKGEYVAFLDQDDVWANDFLDSNIVSKLFDNDITAFSHYATNYDFSRGKRFSLQHEIIPGGGIQAVKKTWLHHSCMIFKKSFLLQNSVKYALSRHEDVIFVHKAAYLSRKIELIDKTMFLYRNNPSSETHRNQNPEDLYIPLLDSYRELLDWIKREHPADQAFLRFVKHMICIYAIEGLEALYQDGRDEKLHRTIAKTQFDKYLTNYRIDASSAPRQIERMNKYFDNYDDFARINRIKGIERRIGQIVVRIKLFKRLYDMKQYTEILPNNICVRE